MHIEEAREKFHRVDCDECYSIGKYINEKKLIFHLAVTLYNIMFRPFDFEAYRYIYIYLFFKPIDI